MKLFAPEGSAEGCASGECLPEPAAPIAAAPAPAIVARPVDDGPPEPPPHDDTDEPPDVEPSGQRTEPARSLGNTSDDAKWRRAVDAVRDASPRHGKSLSYARFLGFIPEGVRIVFPQDAAFHRSQVTGMSRAMVEGELTRALGRPIKLVEDTSAAALQAAPKSIAEVEQTDRSSRERVISDKVKAHPALRSVIRHLGGSLEHIAYLEPATRPVGNAAPAAADESDGGPAVD